MTTEETPIAELMAKDPLGHTQQDLDAIIRNLRANRSRFVLAGDKKVGTPQARKSKAQLEREKVADITDTLDLDDLLNGI